MSKKAPLVLLVSLTCILVFVIGLRYGQYVERTNKQNAVVASITPEPKMIPKKPVGYSSFKHKGCGVELLIPTSLSKASESSTSAVFHDESRAVLSFSCSSTGTGSARLNPYTGKNIYFSVTDSLKPLVDRTLTFLR